MSISLSIPDYRFVLIYHQSCTRNNSCTIGKDVRSILFQYQTLDLFCKL